MMYFIEIPVKFYRHTLIAYLRTYAYSLTTKYPVKPNYESTVDFNIL